MTENIQEVAREAREAKSSAQHVGDRLKGHEELCGERWMRANESINTLKKQWWVLVSIVLSANGATILTIWQMMK